MPIIGQFGLVALVSTKEGSQLVTQDPEDVSLLCNTQTDMECIGPGLEGEPVEAYKKSWQWVLGGTRGGKGPLNIGGDQEERKRISKNIRK